MGKLTQSQADRAGHESPGEDCGWPHQAAGVNMIPNLVSSQRHNRHNLYSQSAAREDDLEKAFDRVPLKVIWWALRKLDVEEWIV